MGRMFEKVVGVVLAGAAVFAPVATYALPAATVSSEGGIVHRVIVSVREKAEELRAAEKAEGKVAAASDWHKKTAESVLRGKLSEVIGKVDVRSEGFSRGADIVSEAAERMRDKLAEIEG